MSDERVERRVLRDGNMSWSVQDVRRLERELAAQVDRITELEMEVVERERELTELRAAIEAHPATTR